MAMNNATLESLFKRLFEENLTNLNSGSSGSQPVEQNPAQEKFFYRKNDVLYRMEEKNGEMVEVASDKQPNNFKGTHENCYVINPSFNGNTTECNNAVEQCLNGSPMDENCKTLMKHTYYPTSKQTASVRQSIIKATQLARQMGLRTVNKTYNGKPYIAFEPVASWSERVKSIFTNNRVPQNLETWMSSVIDVANKNPSVLNQDIDDAEAYFGGSAPNDSSLAGSWLSKIMPTKVHQDVVGPTSYSMLLNDIRRANNYWYSSFPRSFVLTGGSPSGVSYTMVGGDFDATLEQQAKALSNSVCLPNCVKRARALIANVESSLNAQGKRIDDSSKNEIEGVLQILEKAQQRYIKYLSLLQAYNQYLQMGNREGEPLVSLRQIVDKLRAQAEKVHSGHGNVETLLINILGASNGALIGRIA